MPRKIRKTKVHRKKSKFTRRTRRNRLAKRKRLLRGGDYENLNNFADYLGEMLEETEEKFTDLNDAEKDAIKNEIINAFNNLSSEEKAKFNQEAFVIPDELDISSIETIDNIGAKLYRFVKMH